MFGPYFRGTICIPSRDALKDMVNNDVPPDLVQYIIEEGEDYPDTKMSRKEVGRCISKGKNVIFVKLVPSFSYSLRDEIWLIKHIGVARR